MEIQDMAIAMLAYLRANEYRSLGNDSAWLGWAERQQSFFVSQRTCHSDTCSHYTHDPSVSHALSDTEALRQVEHYLAKGYFQG